MILRLCATAMMLLIASNGPALTFKVAKTKFSDEDSGTKASEHTLHLGQQWLRDDEFRLWFYESNYYFVDLILQMKRKTDEDVEYYGTYEFTQFRTDGRTRKYSGKVTCSIG